MIVVFYNLSNMVFDNVCWYVKLVFSILNINCKEWRNWIVCGFDDEMKLYERCFEVSVLNIYIFIILLFCIGLRLGFFGLEKFYVCVF